MEKQVIIDAINRKQDKYAKDKIENANLSVKYNIPNMGYFFDEVINDLMELKNELTK